MENDTEKRRTVRSLVRRVTTLKKHRVPIGAAHAWPISHQARTLSPRPALNHFFPSLSSKTRTGRTGHEEEEVAAVAAPERTGGGGRRRCGARIGVRCRRRATREDVTATFEERGRAHREAAQGGRLHPTCWAS